MCHLLAQIETDEVDSTRFVLDENYQPFLSTSTSKMKQEVKYLAFLFFEIKFVYLTFNKNELKLKYLKNDFRIFGSQKNLKVDETQQEILMILFLNKQIKYE